MMPLRGKLAFGFEDQALGPNKLAAQRRHPSSPSVTCRS
jgi:hypothetical protein